MSKTLTLTWFKLPTALIIQPKFQRLSLEAQAGFVTLCCVYWQDNGVMTYDDAILNAEGVDELIDRGYIDVQDGIIAIEFLDDQLDEVSQQIEQRRQAGRKSAQARVEKKMNDNSTTVERPLNTRSTDKIREDKKEIREDREDRKKEGTHLTVVMPWDTNSFSEIWGIWCKFRTSELRKPKYKEMGEQAALKKLSELAGGDEATAHKIIEQSIANAWQGLFELKTNKPQYNGNRTNARELAVNIGNEIANGDWDITKG